MEIPSLQHEIQQSVPFSSPREEALLAMFRTCDVLHRRIGRVIEPYGITAQQYNVLRILRGAGPSGLATLDITDRMIENAPGITRMIDRLEAKLLVSRERGRQDRRQVVCRITPDGLHLLAKMDAPVRAADSNILGDLGGSEIEDLIRILGRIRSAGV